MNKHLKNVLVFIHIIMLNLRFKGYTISSVLFKRSYDV